MLAYCSALGLREGMLIYCRHDGHPPTQEIEVRHLGTRLRTHAVRLDRSPAHIEAELKALAMAILGRAVGGQSAELSMLADVLG
jgi:5-methylcytosine-specific restriction enzyme subunit McrC